jgi:hypothetical protein
MINNIYAYNSATVLAVRRGFYPRWVSISHKYLKLQLSSTTGSPSTLNSTSTLILSYSSFTAVDRSAPAPTINYRTTLFASPSLTAFQASVHSFIIIKTARNPFALLINTTTFPQYHGNQLAAYTIVVTRHSILQGWGCSECACQENCLACHFEHACHNFFNHVLHH